MEIEYLTKHVLIRSKLEQNYDGPWGEGGGYFSQLFERFVPML